MPDIVRLSVDGEGSQAAQAADLAAWLEGEDVLRGLVRREAAPVPEGALGGELQQLAVTLSSSGVATAVASVVVAWLRRRSGSVSVRVTRDDGVQVELRADRVRTLDAEQLRAQVDRLVSVTLPEQAGRTPEGDGAGDGAAGR